MKRVWRITLVELALVGIALVPAAWAQMGMGQPMGQGMGMRMPRYDTATVTTVKGTVQEVHEGRMTSAHMGQGMGSGPMGLHLLLKTATGSLTILAGPSRFAREKGFTFAVGDKIEVTGSQVTYNDAKELIAREIKKGGKTLILRDENGIPKWSRGRRP